MECECTKKGGKENETNTNSFKKRIIVKSVWSSFQLNASNDFCNGNENSFYWRTLIIFSRFVFSGKSYSFTSASEVELEQKTKWFETQEKSGILINSKPKTMHTEIYLAIVLNHNENGRKYSQLNLSNLF